MDLDQRLNHESGFRYPPIDPRTQIRLLRPLPLCKNSSSREPATSSQRRYVFEIVALKDLSETSYRALSYTWGRIASREDLFPIAVNGQAFWIRRNLHEFLMSYFENEDDTSDGNDERENHDTSKARLIFIDAVCIDQKLGSNTERQAQVLLMREIYRRGNEVISWLGMPPDDASRDSVKALAAAVKKTRGRGNTSQADQWTPAQVGGYRYLSHNRYWTRVWVLQEILLAREVVVRCGEWVFPLGLFAGCGPNTSTWSTRGGEWRQITSTPAEQAITYRLRTALVPFTGAGKDVLAQGTVVLPLEEMMSELRRHGSASVWETREYQTQLPDSLHDVMARYGHLECSDPRDNLYGFLGLLTEKSRKCITVDYSKGVDFAFYQGLQAGLTELMAEIEADVVSGGTVIMKERRAGRKRIIGRFYNDISQAFGEAISVEEGARILQQVLGKMHIHQLFAEVDSALLLREHGYGAEIVSWRDFQRLSNGGGGMDKRVDGGWLSRWHGWQCRAANKVKVKVLSRIRGFGG